MIKVELEFYVEVKLKKGRPACHLRKCIKMPCLPPNGSHLSLHIIDDDDYNGNSIDLLTVEMIVFYEETGTFEVSLEPHLIQRDNATEMEHKQSFMDTMQLLVSSGWSTEFWRDGHDEDREWLNQVKESL